MRHILTMVKFLNLMNNQKNFTYSSCSIINISINTHETH